MPSPVVELTDPPPMPDVAAVKPLITEATKSMKRAEKAWNHAQLCDALRSTKDFIRQAERELREFRLKGR